jgi:hypothetical protein
MLAEEMFIILAFIFLYFVVQALAIAIIVTLFVYMWYISLVVDLVDVYFLTKNKVINVQWLPCFSE